ncbi:MAG: hypothetical protein GY795_31220 [Desulfobacterales bacterium]|nr:hypothetical protein [Desulfobacterales bacterium]
MFDNDTLLMNELAVQKGKIAGFESDGMILVESEDMESLVPCYFIRTAQGPLPKLNIGDPVLFILDSNQEYGYIAGLIEVYKFSKDIGHEKKDSLNYLKEQFEIELSSEKRDITINNKKIIIEADDEIQLKCGKGMILIDKQGKIVIRGTNLISRSSGANKIKGASVNIN